MMHLFLDTNVILDYLLDRGSFTAESEQLFQCGEKHGLTFFISTLTIANVAYFLDRAGLQPNEIIARLMQKLQLTELNKQMIEYCIKSEFQDFEDGLQYFSACSVSSMKAIITRNTRDFIASELPVFTPTELLKLYQ